MKILNKSVGSTATSDLQVDDSDDTVASPFTSTMPDSSHTRGDARYYKFGRMIAPPWILIPKYSVEWINAVRLLILQVLVIIPDAFCKVIQIRPHNETNHHDFFLKMSSTVKTQCDFDLKGNSRHPSSGVCPDISNAAAWWSHPEFWSEKNHWMEQLLVILIQRSAINFTRN